MKNRFLIAGAIASISILGLSTSAQAVSVDLSRGVVGYWSADGYWISGSVPAGYQESATSNQLTITVLPGLTETQSSPSSPHNSFWLGLTGDFSATVTSTVTYTGTGQSGAGGFGVSGTAGRWAEVNSTVNYVDTHYGVSSGVSVGSQPVSYQGTSVTRNIVRTGDNLSLSYSVDGGAFSNVLTLTGQDVLGAVGFYLFGWGPPNDPATTQISFSDFTYTEAPATISGMSGGTSSNPTDLSAASVGSIYGTVGGPGHESDFYTFYWDGGDFSAGVGVPGATSLTYTPDGLRFKLCNGGSCVSQDSYIASVLADESNGWSATLQGELGAGFIQLA